MPITSQDTASYFPTGRDDQAFFRRADLLAASSIYAKINTPKRKPRYNKQNLAPTFTFRITAAAKSAIRAFLETRFGYTRSYIYPDMAELARHLSSIDLPELNGANG